MATYELQGPDGRQYEIEAETPQAAYNALQELLRARQPPAATRPEPLVQAESDRQVRRVANRFSMGLLNYPMDAWTALVHSARRDSPGFGREYEYQRRLTRQAISSEGRGDLGTLGDIASDTAAYTGQAIASAPLMVARTGAELAHGGMLATGAAYSRLFPQTAATTTTGRALPAIADLQAHHTPLNFFTPAQLDRIRTATTSELAAALERNLLRLQIGRESGRVGAAFGVGEGYGNAPDSATTADLLLRMGEHGAMGYALGRAIPAAINVAGDLIASRAGARHARATGADFAAADVPEFTPALGGPLVRGTGSALAGTVFGSSLRSGARRSITALEQRLLQALERAGGGRVRTPGEAGDEVQEFLRRNVVERSRPHVEIENLPFDDLQSIASGVRVRLREGPGEREGQLGTQRQLVGRQHDDLIDERDRLVRTIEPYRTGRRTSDGRWHYQDRPETLPVIRRINEIDARTAELRAEWDRLGSEVAGLAQDRRAAGRGPTPAGRAESYPTNFDAAYEGLRRGAPDVSPKILGVRVPQRGSVPKPRTEGRYTPQEIEDAVAAWEAARSAPAMPQTLSQFIRAMGGIRDTSKDVRAMIGGITGHGRLINNKAGRPLDDIAEAARDAGFFTERPPINELLARLDDDLRGNPVVRLRDEEALIALREHQAILDDLGRLGVDGARSADEVRTILGAEKATVRPPPQPPEDLSVYAPTATARLLDRIAREARGKVQLPGYRDGQVFDESGRVQPALLEYLRPRLGDEVTDILARYSEARARNLATSGLQGTRDIATEIGRAIRDARERGRFPAETRAESEAMLSQLYDAVRQDIAAAASRAGPQGTAYVRTAGLIDDRYRDFMREIRRPLARIFGENVDPGEAVAALVNATQDQRQIGLLRAFYRVVEEKGDRALATSWLLHNMARGGLQGFLASYRAIPEDAYRLMFRGAARELGERLDVLARAGGRLERFIATAGDNYAVDLTRWLRPGNLGFGLLYTISLPALIKGAVTAEASSRILSSQWFGRWLKGLPIAGGPRSVEWQRHVNRLRNFALEELGITGQAADVLTQALLPDPAEAAELPTLTHEGGSGPRMLEVAGKEGAAAPPAGSRALQGEIIPPGPSRTRTVGKGSIQDTRPALGQHNLILRGLNLLDGPTYRREVTGVADSAFWRAVDAVAESPAVGMARPAWWNEARLARLKTLVESGADRGRIAEDFGVSRIAIDRILERRGAELGIPVIPAADRHIWQSNPDRLREFARRWNEGESTGAIAEAMGLGEQQIRSATRLFREALGLERRRSLPAPHRLTAGQLDELVAMVEARISTGIVGERMDVSRQAVHYRYGGDIRTLGPSLLTRRGRRDVVDERLAELEARRSGGAAFDRIVEDIGSGIERARSLEGRIRIREMRSEGATLAQVGSEFRVSPATISRILREPWPARSARDTRPAPLEADDFAAGRLGNQLRAMEDEMRSAGRSPREIARAINQRFREGVTEEEIRTHTAWWRQPLSLLPPAAMFTGRDLAGDR